MDLGQREEETHVNYSIPRRASRRKGVILDWDQELSLMDLAEAMVYKEGLISLERMKRKYIDSVTREAKVKYLDKVIVTYKGSHLPRNTPIYGDMITLRIRPYIEPIRQCFNCFKFGHKKDWCKADRKCINCGEKEHGRCENETRCANCMRMHKTTFVRTMNSIGY